MSRAKIAPTVRSLLIIESWPPRDSAIGDALRAELRALLAVAGSIPALLDTLHDCAVFCESCGYENRLNGEDGPIDGQEAVERALARLRLVSAPRGNRRKP